MRLLTLIIIFLLASGCGDGSSDVASSESEPEPQTTTNKGCSDFETQIEAQEYFDLNGGRSSNNTANLDLDRNGIACEQLPTGKVTLKSISSKLVPSALARGGNRRMVSILGEIVNLNLIPVCILNGSIKATNDLGQVIFAHASSEFELIGSTMEFSPQPEFPDFKALSHRCLRPNESAWFQFDIPSQADVSPANIPTSYDVTFNTRRFRSNISEASITSSHIALSQPITLRRQSYLSTEFGCCDYDFSGQIKTYTQQKSYSRLEYG